MKNDSIFKDKVVLITGGTGFVGQAIINTLLKTEVKTIRVFSRDEVKHFKMQEKIKDSRLRYLVGDVRDSERVLQAVRGADIVIHAAAMKRIDMVEYNITEGIKTNVLGTMNVVKACMESGIERALLISTDKACMPINSYGATKLLAERIFIESNYSKGKCPTVFSAVRYGNVLESTGSIIPIFKEKLSKNLPVPLTNREMTRFLITSQKAVDLIFAALVKSGGGEIFIPKLKSAKITDIIDTLATKMGCRANIENIGIRPGEKIHEALMNDDECRRAYETDEHFIIPSRIEEYQKGINYPWKEKAKPTKITCYSSNDFLMAKKEIGEILE
jgi:FlaA1/EpsC-like NDP-sugar epimerase